jgi:hypothetical protein
MILAIQTPVPPGQRVSVTGSLEGWDAVGLFLIVAALLGVLLWPLIRAWARRIESGGAAAEAQAELGVLRERLGALEERVEFAERLLAQGREPDRLPRWE